MSPSVFSINTILEFLPKQRRTGLFSATQTQEVENLVRAGLRNPVRISVKEKGVAASSTQKTPSHLENHYMVSAGCPHRPLPASDDEGCGSQCCLLETEICQQCF